MTKGITFFNFGGGCAVRLLVAAYSLRDHYTGPLTFQLAKRDEFNDRLAPDLERIGGVQWFDLERLTKRNLKSAIKPSLFKISPYESTLMLDGDLLIQGDPTPLLDLIDKHEFLVTQFSTWNCDGGRMRKRVQRCAEFITRDYMNTLLSRKKKVPAVNIGVMGWKKSAPAVLEDWEKMTMNLAGQHIADEVACQVIYTRNRHYVADETWNSSCLYGVQEPAEAKILHYHGNKHTRIDRQSSMLWLQYLARLVESGKVERMSEFLKWKDKALRGRLKETPNVLREALRWIL